MSLHTDEAITAPPEFDIAEGLKAIYFVHKPIIFDPKDIETRHNFRSVMKQLQRWSIQQVAVRLRAGGERERKISKEDWAGVSSFLGLLYSTDMVHPALKTQLKIDQGLKLILRPDCKFPPLYVKTAKAILDKLESERWGADEADSGEINATSADSSIVSASSSTVSPEPLSSTNNIIITASSTVRAMPADSDPVYGLDGPMHHILRFASAKSTTYSIDPTWLRPNAKFFGAGQFFVGQCWASQMALLRDGAHGAHVAGISGNVTDGAYSIVISGAYEDLDLDRGHELFYSGSNSHENTSPTPVTTNGTRALEVSTTTRKPVRVFRSEKAKWEGKPRKGLRYDGLYRVEAMEIMFNQKGGAYKRFHLLRIEGQDPIDKSKPTSAEAALFSRVKDGYTQTRA